MKQLAHKETANIITTFPIVVICNDFHSPQNVGLGFRICETMGVRQIYLTGKSAVPPNSKIKRTARNAENLVPFSYHKQSKALISELKNTGYAIIGIEITDESSSLYSFDINPFSKIALVFGSERHGISEDLLKELDACYHIPMYGHISSMNVSMAMAIGLYEITKQLNTFNH